MGDEWLTETGQLHRDNDLPAYIGRDGTQMWFHLDRCHRENDLPSVVKLCGTKEWYRNGLRHREGGPALIHPNGREYWYWLGELHRPDGPAITGADLPDRFYFRGVPASSLEAVQEQSAILLQRISRMADEVLQDLDMDLIFTFTSEEFSADYNIDWRKEGF